jgi:hypothetical protein
MHYERIQTANKYSGVTICGYMVGNLSSETLQMMTPLDMTTLELLSDEWARARRKFPAQSAMVTIIAATEELGEVSKAYLEFHHEKQKGVKVEQIRKEAIQLAVMALRIACDCNLEA